MLKWFARPNDETGHWDVVDDLGTHVAEFDSESDATVAAAAPDLLRCIATVPVAPSNFDKEEGCRAYAESIMNWLDTECAAAVDKARENLVDA